MPERSTHSVFPWRWPLEERRPVILHTIPPSGCLLPHGGEEIVRNPPVTCISGKLRVRYPGGVTESWLPHLKWCLIPQLRWWHLGLSISPVQLAGRLSGDARAPGNFIFLENLFQVILVSNDDPGLKRFFYFPKIWNVLFSENGFPTPHACLKLQGILRLECIIAVVQLLKE